MTKRKMKVEPPEAVTVQPVEATPQPGMIPAADRLLAVVTRAGAFDLPPIRAAAEAAGLTVTATGGNDCGLWVQCGPHVPAFHGVTTEEIVAAINAYQCKSCGTGGGHNPNCGAKP